MKKLMLLFAFSTSLVFAQSDTIVQNLSKSLPKTEHSLGTGKVKLKNGFEFNCLYSEVVSVNDTRFLRCYFEGQKGIYTRAYPFSEIDFFENIKD